MLGEAAAPTRGSVEIDEAPELRHRAVGGSAPETASATATGGPEQQEHADGDSEEPERLVARAAGVLDMI